MFQNRHHQPPGHLDHVLTHEQRRIAAQAIENQALIGLGNFHFKRLFVTEMHARRLEAHIHPGNLGFEFHFDAFIRLNLKYQHVGRHFIGIGAGEHEMGGFFEKDRDLRISFGEAFARTDIKRHVGPSPVVDKNLSGDKCFRLRFGIDVRFLPVRFHHAPVDNASVVLPPHPELIDGVRCVRPGRPQDLRFFIAHGVGVEGGRRLHGDQGHQLKNVILDHVAQGARFFVVPAAFFHADVLRDRNLHVIDVISVPQRFENTVRKTERQNILYGFFAEIMIDSIDLPFLERMVNFLIQFAGGFQIAAEGFFDDEAPPVVTALDPGHAVVAQLFANYPEDARRCGKIVQPIVRAADLFAAVLQPIFQSLIEIGFIELPADVVDVVQEFPEDRRALFTCVGEIMQRFFHHLPVFFGRHGRPPHSHDARVLGKLLFLHGVEQRGQDFAAGKIAAAAEDDDGAGAPFGFFLNLT